MDEYTWYSLSVSRCGHVQSVIYIHIMYICMYIPLEGRALVHAPIPHASSDPFPHLILTLIFLPRPPLSYPPPFHIHPPLRPLKNLPINLPVKNPPRTIQSPSPLPASRSHFSTPAPISITEAITVLPHHCRR